MHIEVNRSILKQIEMLYFGKNNKCRTQICDNYITQAHKKIGQLYIDFFKEKYIKCLKTLSQKNTEK